MAASDNDLGHAGRQRRGRTHLHGHGDRGERSADARRDGRPGGDRRGRGAADDRNLSGISAGRRETQPLQITATSDNIGVIPHPTVSYTSPAATGSLAYTPVAERQRPRDHHGDRHRRRPRHRTSAPPRDNLTVDAHVHRDRDRRQRPADAGCDRRSRGASTRTPALQTVNLSGITAGARRNAAGLQSSPPRSSQPTLIPESRGDLHVAGCDRLAGLHAGGQRVRQRGDHGAASRTAARSTPSAPSRWWSTRSTTRRRSRRAPTRASSKTRRRRPSPASSAPSPPDRTKPARRSPSPSPPSPRRRCSRWRRPSARPACSPTRRSPSSLAWPRSPTRWPTTAARPTAGSIRWDPRAFTITVTAVNDPPTLDAIPNPAAILEDAGLQTVNLAGIATGPVGESAQPLQVTATSDNTAADPEPDRHLDQPERDRLARLHAGRQRLRLGRHHRDASPTAASTTTSAPPGDNGTSSAPSP